MHAGVMSTDVVNDAAEVLFCTPVFTQVWPDADELNAYLRSVILAREQAAAAIEDEYSNVGGWHSPIDLQESWDAQLRLVLQRCRVFAEEATARLMGAAEDTRRYRYSISAWANVSREGNYNVPHVHASAWSAVYYISVPEGCRAGGSAGALELIDPRPATAAIDLPGPFFATRRAIAPQPGLAVLFPGSVMHFVHPFRGPGERISIACDLMLEQR
jgi:uncharacterized protein (TIGR02466 family)